MSWLDPPLSAVREVVARALAEDLGVLGDMTASLVPEATLVSALLVARQDGVLAGRLCALETFAAVDREVAVKFLLSDGVEVRPGQVIAEIDGPLASVLTAERTALNLLSHLSGVATLTRRYSDAVAEVNPGCRIRDTRKTTPGLRALEKAAVRAGGGVNHRANLSEAVLVKDNHLGGLSVTAAVEAARRQWPGRHVEVECDRFDQLNEALAAGADMVMLDNMDAAQAAEAVSLVRGHGTTPVEVSGRITLESAAAYARAGVDFVSVGALTHSAPVLDIGLDLGSS
jgi:nicotinate-nucleotide pyrophosphorylase (carboxylating)